MVELDAATQKLLAAQKSGQTAGTAAPAKPKRAAKPSGGNGKSKVKKSDSAPARADRTPALPAELVTMIDQYAVGHTTEFSRVNKGAVRSKVAAAYRDKLEAATAEFIASNADGILD